MTAPTPEELAATTDGLCYGHLSHAEMASKVRMLMRHDLEHEGVCAGARDRIVWLAQREQDLLAEVRRLQAERAAAPPTRFEAMLAGDVEIPQPTEYLKQMFREHGSAPPPVGLTVEQAIGHLEHVVTTYNEHPTALSLTRVAQARATLLRAITARDAEVARAAAETLYEQLGEAIHAALRKASDHEEAGKAYAAIKAMPDKDWWAVLEFAIAGMGFSRAPAPAGECQHSWMGPAQTGPFYCGNCGAQKP